MKNYKDCEKTYIGASDRCLLTLMGGEETGGMKADLLMFNQDGEYSAYIADEETEIPKHYEKRTTFSTYVDIYDDADPEKLSLKKTYKGSKIEFYRAGSFGCIIKVYK
ncbi:MAG: hypothetical protein NC203_09735 [Firmicutes bacterium]|nr:hypothetical protein [[Eubacterium] siraeum]MCM1488636.1 hypothetical protein [Bacillota bacterium]